jgi:hypothetical protein
MVTSSLNEISTAKECWWLVMRMYWQIDVVYLGWPIMSSHISPNAGGGAKLLDLSQWVQLYTGAQRNFGALTPYLTMSFPPTFLQQAFWQIFKRRRGRFLL